MGLFSSKPQIQHIYSLGYYDSFIIENYIIDHVGINLTKLGHKSYEEVFKVDLEKSELFDIQTFKAKIIPVINFIQNFYSSSDDRPLWYRINVIDQAINQYIGIGFLNLENDWIKFIVDYLDCDRAEQNGDTINTIFDINFQWAICFTLDQDNGILKVEKYENQ